MQEKDLEMQKLHEILQVVNDTLKQEITDLKDLQRNFVGNDFELSIIENQKKVHIENLEMALDKPYFARIDFTFVDSLKKEIIYIGKNGVMHDSNVIITDWRAPISSLYYDGEIGDASFLSPEGLVKGLMHLKRQFDIDHGKLINYFDVDLVSNDVLLQKYLNSNNDTRLKSIVATIQKEQNAVIRKNIEDNLIIQGVAGSGKTTVALHRIAYLVYNYIKSIPESSYLVIGPNPVFLKYIKSVLPDLDVSGANQYTYEDFASIYLSEKLKINTSNKKVEKSILGDINNDVDNFKCSIKYKDMVSIFLKEFIASLTKKDLTIGDFVVLTSKEMTSIFNSVSDIQSNSLDIKVNMAIERIARKIKEDNSKILMRYNDYSFLVYQNALENEKQKLKEKFRLDTTEIKKYCKKTLKNYFLPAKSSTTKLYKMFIENIFEYDIYNYEYLENLQKDTLKNIRQGTYDFEDLGALIYIKSKTALVKDYNKIRHTIIDEAQDYGEFNFWVLKEILPSSTFSIFGDLAQSIYDYRSVDNWEVVNKTMFNDTGSVIKFTKSYRTTREIMDVANKVALSINAYQSDLVIRHGKDVLYTKLDEDNMATYIKDKIKELESNNYKSIAVISKTNVESLKLNEKLKKLGLDIPNVSYEDDLTDSKYHICTISNQLAKGLEFDAVIINNASSDNYKKDSTLDMKLLYVAITRALHELDITYTNELTDVLKQ